MVGADRTTGVHTAMDTHLPTYILPLVSGNFLVAGTRTYRVQLRPVADPTERVGRNSTRTVGLQTGDSMCESFEPNDTFCILWQKLKPGNGRQEVDPVKAGDCRVHGREIIDCRLRSAHARTGPSPSTSLSTLLQHYRQTIGGSFLLFPAAWRVPPLSLQACSSPQRRS